MLTGAILMITFSQVPYHFWEKISWPLFLFSVVLLILVFIPGFGREAGGSRRWITIGNISMQPSDPARFGLLLIISRMYTHGESGGTVKNILLLVFTGITALLIKIEPDLGTAIQSALFASLLLLMAGYSVVILAFFFILGIPVMLFTMSAYQWDRILAFLNPYKYRFDSAFQLIASYKSFLTGGFWGQGLGGGLHRHNLQARHTDFILAVVAEDLGTAGIIAILLLYLFISAYALLKLAKIQDKFGRLMGTGIILLFSTQSIMNIAVVMGLLPTTGINLPLISYGGTSVLSYLAMFGILLNILKTNQGNA